MTISCSAHVSSGSVITCPTREAPGSWSAALVEKSRDGNLQTATALASILFHASCPMTPKLIIPFDYDPDAGAYRFGKSGQAYGSVRMMLWTVATDHSDSRMSIIHFPICDMEDISRRYRSIKTDIALLDLSHIPRREILETIDRIQSWGQSRITAILTDNDEALEAIRNIKKLNV